MLTVIPQFKHYQVVRPCRYNDKKHYNLIVQANGFLESCYRHKANHEHPATKSKAKVAEAPGVTHKMKVGFSLGADLSKKVCLCRAWEARKTRCDYVYTEDMAK